MSVDPSKPALASSSQAMTTMKILAIGLIAGASVFLVIAAATRSGKLLADDAWNPLEPLTMVGLIMAISAPAAAFFVSDKMLGAASDAARASGQRPKANPSWPDWPALAPSLFPAYQTAMIVRFAGLEGTAFFNGIAYLLEGSALSVIAAIALIAVMARQFPTEDRVKGWMEAAEMQS